MVKKILFLVFAFGFGAIVYLTSISLTAEKKRIDLLEEAFSSSNYETYLAFSTPYFSKNMVYQDKTTDYEIQVYHVVGEENNKAFLAYVIFVNNLNEDKFTFATDMYDEDDLTNLIVETTEVVYDHQGDVGEEDRISLSFGYTHFKGYYYIYIPSEENTYLFKLYNYEGEVFASFSHEFEIDFDNQKSLEELSTVFDDSENYKKGFSAQEQIAFVIRTINVVMITYALFIIVLFLLIFRKSVFGFIKAKIEKSGN